MEATFTYFHHKPICRSISDFDGQFVRQSIGKSDSHPYAESDWWYIGGSGDEDALGITVAFSKSNLSYR